MPPLPQTLPASLIFRNSGSRKQRSKRDIHLLEKNQIREYLSTLGNL